MALSAQHPAKVVLTGPTGWIGRSLLDMLHDSEHPDRLLDGETVRLFGSSAGSVTTRTGHSIAVDPLSGISPADVEGAHVIHLAYLTKDKVAVVGEEPFWQTNRAIDDSLLAALTASRPASLFVASSGAAQLAESGSDFHPYGLAKLEQEQRFLDYAKASGVPTLCGRIYNLGGPNINKLQDYAISNFAVQALEGGPVRIAADKPVLRSFLHVDDLCTMIIRAGRTALNQDRAIDLCGTEIVELQHVAQLIVKHIDSSLQIRRPDVDYRGKAVYLGKAVDTIILAMRLNCELQGLHKQIHDTIDWIRASSGVTAPAIH